MLWRSNSNNRNRDIIFLRKFIVASITLSNDLLLFNDLNISYNLIGYNLKWIFYTTIIDVSRGEAWKVQLQYV